MDSYPCPGNPNPIARSAHRRQRACRSKFSERQRDHRCSAWGRSAAHRSRLDSLRAPPGVQFIETAENCRVTLWKRLIVSEKGAPRGRCADPGQGRELRNQVSIKLHPAVSPMGWRAL